MRRGSCTGKITAEDSDNCRISHPVLKGGLPVMEILSWGIVVAIAFGFLTLGYNSLQVVSSSEEFWITRFWALLAAITLLSRFIVWGLQTNRHISLRIVVCVIACGSLAAGTIEAMRYVNRRQHRWALMHHAGGLLTDLSRQVVKEKKAENNKPETRPNLVDRGVRVSRAHQDIWSQVLVEGASDRRYSAFDPDWTVLTIEICNEFQVIPKTIGVDDLTAEIRYAFPDDSDFKLNRGAWLGGRNRIALAVNDSGYLIIVLSQISHSPQVRIFTREYPQQEYIHLDPIMNDLPHGKDYPVEVKLISESRGEQYATFNYMLAVDEEGSVEFVRTSDWEVFKRQRTEGHDNA